MDDDEEHEPKKSRTEGDALMESDVDVDESKAPKRGSKRGLREEDVEELSSSKKARGKRARKGPTDADHSMDVDIDDEEADEVSELRSAARGKKRDRAEAGSTFGGDDDESADEVEGDGNSKARRRRKRRTVAKRKSEASYLRSKKGDEDVTEASSPDQKAVRTKRGKRASHGALRDHDGIKDDVSMDGSTTSNRSKVRSVGDEWESNGIRYKIGPNYQRLRQALVKKERQKFLMPKDSQHPDREEHLQVCIETWLTEEEYQDAKNQHRLAWQDDSPRPEPADKLSIDVTHANANANQPGKSLLWGSSTTTTPTMSPAPPSPVSEAGTADSTKPAPKSYRGGQRHSIASGAVLPGSPFATSHIPTAKRIASTSQALSLAASIGGSPLSASGSASPVAGLSDSTNAMGSPRTPLKVFSKWEKQELEARAMMKIREANRKKEMERDAKLKEERDRAERAEKEKERQRQERERVEREQREARERAQKEAQQKAEAEKKAKEAAEGAQKSAAVPQITITAPSIGNLGQQPSRSNTAASGSAPTAGGGGFSFNLSGAPSSGTAASSPFSAPKTGSLSTGNPFGAPTNTVQSGSPDAVKTESKPASSGFSFGPSPAGATSPAPAASLASRLGVPAPAANSDPVKPSSTSPFSFNNTKQDSPPKSNPFGAPVPPTQPAASSSDSTATVTPKFNFGFGAKPTTNASTNNATAPKSVFGAPSTSASSLSGALGSDAAKAATGSAPAPSPFAGFKTPTTPASATNGNTATTTPATSASSPFGFGGGSTFGSSSAFPSTTTTAGQNNAPGKSVFGTTNTASTFGAGSNPNTSSAFGASSTPNASSAFGGSTGSGVSPFGAAPAQTQSVFGNGAAAAKSSEPTKPLFSFPGASSASTTPASASTANSGAKSAFSFAPTAPTVPAAANTPAGSAPAGAAAPAKFSFNFGGSATPASTPAAASPFGGASSGQSVFGGGVFGSTAMNQAQKQ
ncbi:hypothetical protein HYPSUDRAFT_229912 [Hypholoma sublateritium FD-334 SS-4]|uniref:Uncharacterized protein n=1 Tax=Hypholoma sublateritium (strain FD-334 SS-4) TaxID=945553 RepID=A0A0D2N004_HYPSF|nr:hypothetical protein HYPSUDRAFT_229912 [Hypholoma sublateritium FD-334 SS-4]